MSSSILSIPSSLSFLPEAETSRRSRIVSCQHCGQKGVGFVTCGCAEIIEMFGSRGCSCCGIWYDTFNRIGEYAAAWGSEYAYYNYDSEMMYWMTKPCTKCSVEYKTYYTNIMQEYRQWRIAMKDKYEPECTAATGYAPCKCCGGMSRYTRTMG